MYTLQEKTRSTSRTLSTLDSRMVGMVVDHTSPVIHIDNLSLVPTRMKHDPTPGRSLGASLRVGERGFGQVVTQIY
jgi:hypothetical protein